MRTQTQITTAIARNRDAGDRPPILSALAVLGLNYAAIARLFGIPTMTVSEWATGKRPIPRVRRLALHFLVARLTGKVDRARPPQTRYARRTQIAIDAALAWAKLDNEEQAEDGGVLLEEDVRRGMELGQRMLTRLEAQ
jgi:hypothetical protein